MSEAMPPDSAPQGSRLRRSTRPRPRRRRCRIVSPGTLLVLAALPAVVCGVLHLMGTRDYLSLLAGTGGDPAGQSALRVGQALVYAASFLATVLLSPIFALAAVIWWVLALPARRRRIRFAPWAARG